MHESEEYLILKSARLVAVLTLCSRVTGLIRDAALGYLLGTAAAADAFFVAFRAPNLLRRLVAEGAVGAAFVPVFSHYLLHTGRDAALEAARAVLGVLLVSAACMVLVGVLLAPCWVPLLAPGFAATPQQLHLTTQLARILFGYLLLVAVAACLGGFLHVHRHFAAPAAAPILFNISVISAVLVAPHLRSPVHGVACGVLLGGVMQVVLPVLALLRLRICIVPQWSPRDQAVRLVGRRMFPVMLGAAVYQVNLIVGTMFASVLPSGSVSYLWYADRVFEFPLGILAVALGTAALPSFSEQATLSDLGALRNTVAFALRTITFLAIPATVGIVVLALPITTVLFQRGAFGPYEAQMTARTLQALAIGLWAVSAAHVLVAAAYALHDTRTPAIAACVGVVTNILFSLMFMGSPHVESASTFTRLVAAADRLLGVFNLRHVGLALSASLAGTVNAGLLFRLALRRLRDWEMNSFALSLARSITAALVMAATVWLSSQMTDWSGATPFWQRGAALLGCISIGVCTYGLAAYALGAPEIAMLRALVTTRQRG